MSKGKCMWACLEQIETHEWSLLSSEYTKLAQVPGALSLFLQRLNPTLLRCFPNPVLH